jgi:dihydrofolate reductase
MMAGGEGALLLGRRTYEDFCAVWPKRTDNPYTEYLNKVQKYVASTTLKVPLPWQNSILLSGDAADAVATLKREQDKSFTILGSGELIRCLSTCYINPCSESTSRTYLSRSSGGNTGTLTRRYPKAL